MPLSANWGRWDPMNAKNQHLENFHTFPAADQHPNKFSRGFHDFQVIIPGVVDSTGYSSSLRGAGSIPWVVQIFFLIQVQDL